MKKILKLKSKGFAGLFSMIVLFIITLLCAFLTIELGRAYTTRCKSQTVADAVANAIGAYASDGATLNLTKATQMFTKMQSVYPGYNLYMDRGAINDNHVKVSATADVVHKWDKGLIHSIIGKSNRLTGNADVELVPQTQLAKIKNAFPADKTQPVNPFVTGDHSNYTANNAMLIETLISQFYVEGRNRYRFSGTQRTVYGDLTAQELLLFDVFKTLGYSASFENWNNVNINDTKGNTCDKPFTNGYVYTGIVNGNRYIVSNPNEEGKATVLYLDESMEAGMTLKKVDFNSISDIQRSPTKWYVPKNEEEIKKLENTKTFK